MASHRCYEVARKHGKSITVMEPVKGGQLANPIPQVRELLDKANPNASYASWAIRYAASLDGIITVLSGMSSVEQMRDNLSYMKDFRPLTETEQETIRAAQAIINGIDSIPCTGCRYCCDGCPMQISIPDIFRARNTQLVWGNVERGVEEYGWATADGGKAGDCIQCGQCEAACPQQIDVIERLRECAANFGI